VSALFDDLVVSSSIPAPGAIALLGIAGLSGRRRRG
jgi:MYXO-CTERM domain-containing protein